MDNLFLEINTDINSSGSATWDYNGHHVIVSIYGPDEAKITKELTHRAYVDVTVSPASGMHTPHHTELEVYLTNLLERLIEVKEFPRSKISVRICIVSGNCLHPCTVTASINATVLALLHSGLPLRSTVAAVTVCIPLALTTTNGSEGSSFVVETAKTTTETLDCGMLISVCLDVTHAAALLAQSSTFSSIDSESEDQATGTGVFSIFFGRQQQQQQTSLSTTLGSLKPGLSSLSENSGSGSSVSPTSLLALLSELNARPARGSGAKALELANIIVAQLMATTVGVH